MNFRNNATLTCAIIQAAFAGLFLPTLVSAELIQPVALSPAASSYATGAVSDPLRPAWTYPNGGLLDDGSGNDVWQFDLSAFDPAFSVSVAVGVGDWGAHQDDYNLYWDGDLLGNTGLGTFTVFAFDTTADQHTLRIDWLNPIGGGSWYNIEINAATGAPVPIPGVFVPFIAALLGLSLRRRR